MSAQLAGQSGNIYGSLAPQLAAEASHPAGYTPPQKAAMNTAAQQSAGGSNAGAVGQGALLASRTRNAGTADAAIAESSRASSDALSKAALGTEMKNADLQQQQRQEGLKGEQGLYNTDLGASQSALGLSNQALNTANNVKVPFWQQYILNGQKAAMEAGAAAGA